MATKKKPKKALEPASSFIIDDGAKDKTLHDWLEREEDKLLEWVLEENSQYNVFHIANALKREPLCVLRHILDSEITEMAGFDCGPGTEEESEFIGLALSGVPLQACLLWCVADEGRPTTAELTSLMTVPDMRAQMNLARTTGMWFGTLSQMRPLDELLTLSEQSVADSVSKLLERFEAPTPQMVLIATKGKLEFENPPVIRKITQQCHAPVRSYASKGKKKYAKRKSYKKSWPSSSSSAKKRKPSAWA